MKNATDFQITFRGRINHDNGIMKAVKFIPLSLLLLFLFFTLSSCIHRNDLNSKDKAKVEIFATEQAFAAKAKAEGLSSAFGYYAADDAVINYNDKLIQGKTAIKKHYQDKKYDKVSLDWTPDFVDVSASCDLGYTYGNYTYSTADSTGKPITFTGIFHTVWKKQVDGTWRFVWD